jgi:hypothetical protein
VCGRAVARLYGGAGIHSPFATALIAHLKVPGREVRRMFDYISDDVIEATHNRQQPFTRAHYLACHLVSHLIALYAVAFLPSSLSTTAPALLLDFSRGPCPKVGRNAAVHHVEHKHGLPFLTLCRMDCRKGQIILIQQRHASLITGGVRRIEGEFGQEPLAGWKPAAICSSCRRSACRMAASP